MTDDMRRVVAAGYDDIADAYLERFGVSIVRQRWLDRLVDSLSAAGCDILDLGCGAGVPVARDLTALGHRVIGIDGSTQQIIRARRNVPLATFVEADMCDVTFEAESFDAVCAFYSMTHIPAVQQDPLIANIATWMKPGGTLVASFGTGEAGDWTGEWLGTTMFFSHRGQTATMKTLAEAGLRIRHVSIERQDNEDAAFMWVEANKDH